MKDLREEVVTEAYIVGKLVKSRMTWAGHMVKMKEERLYRKERRQKIQGGWRKRGRPQIRWEDCLKGDLRNAVYE